MNHNVSKKLLCSTGSRSAPLPTTPSVPHRSSSFTSTLMNEQIQIPTQTMNSNVNNNNNNSNLMNDSSLLDFVSPLPKTTSSNYRSIGLVGRSYSHPALNKASEKVGLIGNAKSAAFEDEFLMNDFSMLKVSSATTPATKSILASGKNGINNDNFADWDDELNGLGLCDFNGFNGFGGLSGKVNPNAVTTNTQTKNNNDNDNDGFDILPINSFDANIDKDNNENDNKDENESLLFDFIIPTSKIIKQTNIQTANSVITSNNNNNNDDKFGEAQPTPDFYNEYTSCTTDSQPRFVLLGLESLCNEYAANGNDNNNNNYEKEIEFEVDYQLFEIHGLLYLKHKPIRFTISVWTADDENNESTSTSTRSRIEFRKMRGDSLLFQHFWSDMLELIYKNFNNVISYSTRCGDFASLFMPTFDDFELDDVSSSDADTEMNDNDNNNDGYYYNNNDLDYFANVLKNDYRDDAVDTLAMLCNELSENKDKENKFYQLVSKHEKLINTLMFDVITHNDQCHIRGGLCVLNIIASKELKYNNNSIIAKFSSKSRVLSILQKMISNNSSQIVKEHAIHLKECLNSYNCGE